MRIDPRTQCDQDVVTHRFYADLRDARERRVSATIDDTNGAFTMVMAGTMAGVLAVALIWLGQNIDVVLGWLS